MSAFFEIAVYNGSCSLSVSTVLPDWWISRWTALSLASSRDHTEILIYIALVGASTVLVFVEAFLVLQAAVVSSTTIHNKMLDAVIKAPVIFFDTNPTGRILNRFTKDIGKYNRELKNLPNKE